jgi:Zn finger protein HypA/HybF involved in hydrogenase expression
MGTVKLTVAGFKCERCNHEWIPKKKAQEPRVCPKCKSAYWNVPRRKPSAKKAAR